MAMAATAAPPIVRRSFQSEDKIFNDTAPWLLCGILCRGAEPSLKRGDYFAASRSNPHAGNFTQAEGRRLLRRRSMHRITQHADADDADVHDVACNQRPHTSGRAGGDYIAGKERHHAGNPANQKGAGINHERRTAGLAHGAVYASFDENVSGIERGFYMRPDRAESVEALDTSKLDIALLNVAGGDVVE